MKKDIYFCQISNDFIYDIESNSIESRYYDSIFEIEGYDKTDEFWEIPLWIAEADFFLKEKFNTKLLVITNINEFVTYIKNTKPEYLLFSVLDVTKSFVKEILSLLDTKQKVIMGGYIDANYLNDYLNKNVIWLDDMQDLSLILDVEYKYGNDYTLFKNTSIIPRLKLSNGCLHHCKFCTVDKYIREMTKEDIIQVANSFKLLKFKYIYIDDKTFGQAKNYILLEEIYKIIMEYNPQFLGFIIQTTVNMLIKEKIDFKKLHIKIAEVGLETFNDEILRSLRKPSSEKNILKSLDILYENKVSLIPNIVVGLQGETFETYNKTLKLLRDNMNNILFFNIYSLSIYKGTDLEKEMANNYIESDSIEANLNKSFHSEEDKKNNLFFIAQLYKLYFDNYNLLEKK